MTNSWYLILNFHHAKSLVTQKRKGSQEKNTIGNTILAENATRQHASTTRGGGRTSKRSHGDQTAQTDAPPAKRTTHHTRSTTEESQHSALMEADIPHIVNTVKRGLSDFTAGAQVSDILKTDEEEEDFNPIGECMVLYCW